MKPDLVDVRSRPNPSLPSVEEVAALRVDDHVGVRIALPEPHRPHRSFAKGEPAWAVVLDAPDKTGMFSAKLVADVGAFAAGEVLLVEPKHVTRIVKRKRA